MDPQPPIQPTAPAPAKNSLAVMQPGEQTLFSVRRHPIGILGIYVTSGVLLIAAAVLCFLVPQHISTSSTTRATEIGALAFLIVAVFTLLFVFISTKVYWGNQWILTTDSITQINQTSLFSRQSSQLSLGNLEDVTAEQNGMLTHMFNYGLLKVETAGERSKFSFAYCPNPNYYAQQVIAAREAFEQRVGNGTERSVSQPIPPVPYQQDAINPNINNFPPAA